MGKIEVYKRVHLLASAEFQRHLPLEHRLEGEFKHSCHWSRLHDVLAYLRRRRDLSSESGDRQHLSNPRNSSPTQIRTAIGSKSERNNLSPAGRRRLMKIVLKLGGHNLTEKLTPEALIPYLNVIRTLAKQGHRIATVVGGGRIARDYIGVARKFRADESLSDELGIDVARLNAKLLIAGLADLAWQRVPTTLEEVAVGFQSGKIIVMGGLTPGQSTSAVSALVAERIRADLLLIATNVDGVYSVDPRKNKKAEKLDKVGTRALYRIIREGGVRAGEYELLDLVTLSILERSKLKTIIFNGSNPQNILKAVSGTKIGTVVN